MNEKSNQLVKSNIVKINATDITKKFELMKTRSQKAKSILSFNGTLEEFWSLKGISFEVNSGETVAIVGLNGSGKSTLLSIIGGVYPQTTGKLKINGSTSIISINAGLRNTLTGRENIELKLLMNGYTKKQINIMLPDIINFSELGNFIDQPIKSYSSGMKSKLGFSIMAHTDPDIMIIDEALSVGDAAFAKKSFDKIREFRERGKTIFFVSHSASQVRSIADRVMWMYFGELREFGPAKEVLPHWEKWQRVFNSWSKERREAYLIDHKRTQRELSIEDVVKNKLEHEINDIQNNVKRPTRATQQLIREKKAILSGNMTKLAKEELKAVKNEVSGGRFGIFNWLLVSALLFIIIFTAMSSINADHNSLKTVFVDSSLKSSSIESSKNSESVAKQNSITEKEKEESRKASIASSQQEQADSIAASQQADSIAASQQADSIAASQQADSIAASQQADSIVASQQADSATVASEQAGLTSEQDISEVVPSQSSDSSISNGNTATTNTSSSGANYSSNE